MIIHKRRSWKRTLRNILISAGIMLALLIGAGVVYEYITGKDAAAKLGEAPVAKEEKPIEQTPVAQDPNAPNSAAVQYIESPVKAGQNSTINVHTGPKATCVIEVSYKDVVSKDSGLKPKTADVHGIVEWAWTVDQNAPTGKWPVKVTCTRNGKAAFVQGDLVVQ